MTRLVISTAIVTALVSGRLPAADEPSRELPPLVVTARRGSVLPEHFSGNATVIDEAQVTGSGARSLGDLLETQGGLRITSTSGDSSRGSIHLRGFGENASSRTLVLIDGKPLNRPDLGGSNLQEIPLARVARVEILRGSQTARFGDQAVGGVVNIVTKTVTGEPTIALEFAAGSDQWLLARVNHAANHQGHLLTLDAEQNQTDGWRDNSGSEVFAVAAGWTHRLEAGPELAASLSWVDQSGRFPGPLTTAQYQTNPRQSIYSGPFAEQYGSSQTSVRVDLSAKFQPGKWGDLDLPFTWQTRDLSWNMGPGSHADNTLRTLTFTPTLRQSGSDWSTEEGLALRADWLDVTQYREMARIRPNSSSNLERIILEAFASGEWEPWQDWHLNGALRASWSSLDASSHNVRRPNDTTLNFDRSNSETNGACQLGLRWEPALDTTAWFRYDRLYRLPSVDEIASYQGFPMSRPFNDQLHAETGHNLELGTGWTPGSWELKVNAFAQLLHGEIAYDYVANLNVNLADTRRLGGEVELGYRAENWSASVRYAAVDARYTSGPYDGKQIYLVPSQQLSSMLEYRPHRTFTARLEYQWQSSCYEGNDLTNTQPRLPAFAVMNLLLKYQPTEQLSCYVRIANLWDEHYATIKYSGLWYPAAGRQLQFGIRHAF